MHRFVSNVIVHDKKQSKSSFLVPLKLWDAPFLVLSAFAIFVFVIICLVSLVVYAAIAASVNDNNL